MPEFKWNDLFDAGKIAANGHWIVVGAIAGGLIYHFMVAQTVTVNVPASAISIRSPMNTAPMHGGEEAPSF